MPHHLLPLPLLRLLIPPFLHHIPRIPRFNVLHRNDPLHLLPFPKHPFAWKILGVVLKQMGRLSESLLPSQKSVALSPDDADAHSNLGVVLRDLGRLSEAEATLRQAAALSPEYAEAYINLGVILGELGKLDEAETTLRQAVALRPEYAEAYINLGVMLRKLGKLEEAEITLRQAIALRPEFAEAHNNLGAILQDIGKLAEAEATLRQAVALKPGSAEAHNTLGATLQELGKLEEAEATLRQAIALRPQYAKAHSNLGTTLRELGRLDEAEVSLRHAIELQPNLAEAHLNLAKTIKFSPQDEQFGRMEKFYRDPMISDIHRCQICFALAKASDDIGELTNAFEFYAEGNALRKKQLGYEKTQDQKLFEKLKANHSSIASHSLQPKINAAEPAPIFILGLPRSGTTLVEQIISSNPLVTGAGELTYVSEYGRALAAGQTPVDARALTTFKEQYLNALQLHSEGKAIVSDKMPHNFQFLGLIAATFPGAKIIHVKRDPAAVCWANYTQYFVTDYLGYCYGLDDVMHYHELYEDLMKYWHQALPDRIYDLDYEALTENQEEETRNLISHLGLEWNDACLSPQDNTRGVATASAVQVRQKVYQGSSEKWKRYRPFLNGVLDHLSAGGN